MRWRQWSLWRAAERRTEGTKAGGQAAPVILRIGTDDSPGRPAADQIGEFARQVEELSDGGVRIEPVWNAAGDTGEDDWDQKVARMVVAGEVDMGLIPARAWDTEGVTSLRALNAPFLITSDELAAEVASSELAGTMLAGLDTVGVTGLALCPRACGMCSASRTRCSPLATSRAADPGSRVGHRLRDVRRARRHPGRRHRQGDDDVVAARWRRRSPRSRGPPPCRDPPRASAT